MSDQDPVSPGNRPALPRDAFRMQRTAATPAGSAAVTPVVVTPAYDDVVTSAARPKHELAKDGSVGRKPRHQDRKPFEAYGERSSSRPYALRLPDPIDLVVRQLAAEQRTHPLRIIDRILHDYLKRIGRLPPQPDE